MYFYRVQYYNIANKICQDCGIVSGKNYGRATNKVVKDYGRDNVIEVCIYEMEDILCYDEIMDTFKQGGVKVNG